jgi:hypothetical protein
VWRAGHARRRSHARNLERAPQAAHVHDIRLHDIDRARLDHARPGCKVPVLFAAGDVDVERVGDLAGFLELPVRAGFLVVPDALRLEQAPDFDRAPGRVAAVRVDELRDAVAQSARDGGHDLLRAARPLIDVAPAFRGHAPFEGIESLLVAQPQETCRFSLGRDVALHRRGVGAQRAGLAAQQLDDGAAFELATQVPHRRVEAGQRAAAITAGEFVLAPFDLVDQRGDVECVGAQRPRRHLAMEHAGRDVGVVRGCLAPADCAVVGGQPHETDEFIREGFEAGNPGRGVHFRVRCAVRRSRR